MKKLMTCLGLLMALSFASGCTLYFGPDDDDDWADDPPGTGWSCYSDYDCAAGCYCDTGYYGDGTYGYGECVEAGYCTSDADCGWGYQCDESRSSCVPGDVEPPPPPPPACSSDADCAAACYCDEETGTCVETSYCATDEDCAAAGMVCDEDRQTCVPEDPTEPPPPPPPPPPSCSELTDETSCVDRDDCVAIYAQYCYDPNGNACTQGSQDCVCDGNFQFVRCDPLAPSP